MNPIIFDDAANDIIGRHLAKHSDAALRLEIKRAYSRGCPYSLLALGWTTRGRAERDTSLVRCGGPRGVPVFIARRLTRYLAWHPLRVLGLHFGPFTRLMPQAGPFYVDDLRAWERAHPTTESPVLTAA
jgi:hypothetical protein